MISSSEPRTPGMHVIYSAETGERFERWPIDAREMLETGAYTREIPDSGGEVATPPLPRGLDPESLTDDPVPHLRQAEAEAKVRNVALNPQEPPVPSEAPSLPEIPTEAPKAVEVAFSDPDWPLKVTPDAYLARHPNGKHAELAQAIIDTR